MAYLHIIYIWGFTNVLSGFCSTYLINLKNENRRGYHYNLLLISCIRVKNWTDRKVLVFQMVVRKLRILTMGSFEIQNISNRRIVKGYMWAISQSSMSAFCQHKWWKLLMLGLLMECNRDIYLEWHILNLQNMHDSRGIIV